MNYMVQIAEGEFSILHPSSLKWKPAEELNLVPFHPALAGSV